MGEPEAPPGAGIPVRLDRAARGRARCIAGFGRRMAEVADSPVLPLAAWVQASDRNWPVTISDALVKQFRVVDGAPSRVLAHERQDVVSADSSISPRPPSPGSEPSFLSNVLKADDT